MSELKFKFKMPDDETLAKYIPIKGEKGEKGDPTKLSQLENDTGFVTANTNALANYYTKAQTDSAIDADVEALDTELGVPDGFFTDTTETVSGQGTTIALSSTTDAILKDIKLYGDTLQNGTPTPASPVSAQSVTGEQTIIISDNAQQSQSYTINLGKNLFDKTDSIVENYTYIGDGSTTAMTGCSLQEAYISVEPNQTYTLSTLIDPTTVNDFRIFILEYDKEKEFIRRNSDGSQSASRTITTTASTFYVRLCFSTVTIPSLMFEKGSTVTSYARYFEPIELCKLGNFQDYIYKSNNKWYLHKATGKAIFDGSENWSKSGRSNSTAFVGALSVVDKGINFSASQSTKADKSVKTNTTPMTAGTFDLINTVNGSAQYLLVALDASTITDVSVFKAWLTANTLTIFYPLTTAIDTEITEEPLISQLERLSFAKSYESQTQTTCNGDLSAILSLVAFKNNWNGTTAGLDNGIDQLVAETNTVNSRLGLLDNRKYIFLGDSYCEGYTPDGHIESWAVKLKSKMGLTDANCSIVYNGGWGFGYENKWFSKVLDRLPADPTVTDIVVCGGYNDKQATYDAILAGMQAFATVRDAKFPKAHIHVGFIAQTNAAWSRLPLREKVIDYIRATAEITNASYMTNVEYSLKRIYDCFSSDGYHPNTRGQEYIAQYLKNAIITGSANVLFTHFSMAIEADSRWDSEVTGLNGVGCSVNNGTTIIEQTYAGAITLKTSTAFDWLANGSTWIDVGTITDGFVVGNGYNSVVMPTNLVVKYDDDGYKYKGVQGQIRFEAGKMQICAIEAAEGNYTTIPSVMDVQIFPFSGSFDSLFC